MVAGSCSILNEAKDFLKTQVFSYDFGDELVSIEHFDFDPLKEITSNVKLNFDSLTQAALKNIEEAKAKGAEVIIIACGSPELSEFASVLNKASMEKYDIPVLTPIDTAIEVARAAIAKRQK